MRSNTFRLLCGVLLALLLGLASSPLRAQVDPRAQAAVHFDRGIAFFNESRFDAALAELARAHELAPAPATLYNLARVHAALGQAVEASAAYEAYLEEAGASVNPQRRAAVQAALAEQRTRIGELRIECDVAGATISIDGVDVETTPLESPIALSAGSHSVEVRAPGHEAVRRAVSIAGQSTSQLAVSLREAVVPRGNLRILTSVPEVAIQVDGEPVGVTPLASTLALHSGGHSVRASRPGYRTEERQVQVEEGADVELSLTMQRAPQAPPSELGRVRLRLPNAPHLLRVDGELMVGDELELPVGLHRLHLEVTDRRPYESSFRVPAASMLDVEPPLWWTLHAREERVAGANTQRVVGVGMTVIGGAILGTGIALLAWNEAEIAQTDSRIIAIVEELDGCARNPEVRCEELMAEGEALQSQQDTQNALRGVSIAATVIGAGFTGVGVALWIAAPSEDDIDEDARARLYITPNGMDVRGSF